MPFTKEEIALLWKHKNIAYVDTILIYIYSGWRISKLFNMSIESIDLENKTMTSQNPQCQLVDICQQADNSYLSLPPHICFAADLFLS